MNGAPLPSCSKRGEFREGSSASRIVYLERLSAGLFFSNSLPPFSGCRPFTILALYIDTGHTALVCIS